MTGSKRPFVRIAWRKIANAMGTLREVKETLGLNALCPGNETLEAALVESKDSFRRLRADINVSSMNSSRETGNTPQN